eukprot:TRINITY_DN10399_c0_g1_i1.p1 TRINITY_DN10399_c0_g1~~TRINITY_DN10399_c0_g1_i1.p1  ORF type:complete len:141 (-),score=22.70 TRINITY_DN10399_c0_g1_i1:194-616(-)
MSAKTLYFSIVAKGDSPIYETHLIPQPSSQAKRDDLLQLILHAALDSVDQKVWTTTAMYLKDVDKFNEYTISAFVTAGHIKFLLLHDHKTDENAIKSFFYEIYELYVKICLNPFYEKNSQITSKSFDERVKVVSKKCFST